MLRRIHRTNGVNVCLVLALLASTLLPPQAFAPPESPETATARNTEITARVPVVPARPQTPGTYEPRLALMLQPGDEPQVIADRLIAAARRAHGPVRIRSLSLRAGGVDPRVPYILRELRNNGINFIAEDITTPEFEAEVERARQVEIPTAAIRSAIENEARLSNETPRQGFVSRLLGGAGRTVRFAALLPGWLAGRVVSYVSGREYQALNTFLVEPDPTNPNVRRPAGIDGEVFSTALWTTVVAVAMIPVTQYVIGPHFNADLAWGASNPEERLKLAAICTALFGWILATLTYSKEITNWRDQVVSVHNDPNAAPGDRIRLVLGASIAVNFGLQLFLETMMNFVLPTIELGMTFIGNGVTETTLGTVMTWLYKIAWAPIVAVASVFSYIIPGNIIGRGLDTAQALIANPATRARGEILKANIRRFSFWFWVGIGMVFNAARFFPDQDYFLGIPANKWPLIATGLAFVGWEYGRSIVRAVGRGIGWLTGNSAVAGNPPAPTPTEPPCTYVILEEDRGQLAP